MANPVILTVDDDPVVSRAVARDIRRRYGDRYRVLRASSGPEALDALREVKLRGEQVALLLADHRMPEMTGVEFLEAAMDIFPAARRVLLTAYADTDAAIEAINVVDLDHYLLKPWHPPEEKLYPVVDGLLEAWALTPDAGPRRPWFHRDRSGSARRGAATGRLVVVARPVPPGDQRAGRVRCRGRAGRVGQAGRLGRRRGCDGGVAGAPLPGGPVSRVCEPRSRERRRPSDHRV
ncbi:response regulator [Micromonospora sp. H61]|uniref:response regulator n=1 Tax=Micromonospora sp. H61 TaxID=2824888 RepID=UPI0027DB8407|nr:response regulator [Micromonospora sp. H61]